MGMPTFVSAGATSGDVGNVAAITPAMPAGIASNDILLLFLETSSTQAITIADSNGGSWAEVTGSPQESSATRLTVFWSRYNGTQGAPTTDDSGNHNLGVIVAFRGCKTTGNPWNITSAGSHNTANTSLSITGATTTAANCLVVIGSSLDDSVPDFGATWTNSDLASISSLYTNVITASGNDGRIGVLSGQKASAGAYGATTNTLTANATKAFMTIALEGAATAAAGYSYAIIV